MKRVAVIGSGVAGVGAAWALAQAGRARGQADVAVTLFEADNRLGGHAHTVDVTLPDENGRPLTHGVDTGFLVFNERTYPRLIRWFDQLGVPTAPSEMSFSVQVPPAVGPAVGTEAWLAGLQWCGSSIGSVFVQRRNLLSGRFWGMLADLIRFNRLCTAIARRGDDAALAQPVGEFLDQHRFGAAFREAYLLPMVACIWSCPLEQMLRFPVGTLIRFCHNHGLLQIVNRPQWFTVRGGSREYIRRAAASISDIRLNTPVRAVQRTPGGPSPVVLHTAQGHMPFDEVILACHSDQALRLLGAGASVAEREVLGAIGYHRNRAVLHTDASLLPPARGAWAAWNYERSAPGRQAGTSVCLHYLLNTLQPLPWKTPVVVSLNPLREPRPETVLGEYDYAHPVFDMAAVAAQQRLGEIQGQGGVWFCGAWTGYGFHEDGLRSGQQVAQALLVSPAHAADSAHSAQTAHGAQAAA